ncbi:hypothetical protein CMU10_00730 [Elizabethkingia anophelis]|nr:hypothetical protein [Elizabethkingia anophelis]MDV3796706.1 hypothetical protein [Elizabethkingia anophelis]OCW72187.1 hypothetical protein A4G24_10630 [Elizabethkingia anophelis]
MIQGCCWNLAIQNLDVLKTNLFWDTNSKIYDYCLFIGDSNIGIDLLKTNQLMKHSVVYIGNVFVNSINIYPGLVFSSSNINNLIFDSEIKYERNLYDLNFMFSNPYVVEDIENIKGLSNYNK